MLRTAFRFRSQLYKNSTFSLYNVANNRFFSTIYYAKSDEYLRIDENDSNIAYFGVSDYAQDQLNEIVHVDLPDVEDSFDQGDEVLTVDSTKGVSECYAPVDFDILEVNDALEDAPELVNDSAELDGWMVKVNIKDASQLESLMNAEEYKEYRDL